MLESLLDAAKLSANPAPYAVPITPKCTTQIIPSTSTSYGCAPPTTENIMLDEIETWAQFMAASVEDRRAFMRELLAEWEMNRTRDLAEDERGDGFRGHWGD